MDFSEEYKQEKKKILNKNSLLINYININIDINNKFKKHKNSFSHLPKIAKSPKNKYRNKRNNDFNSIHESFEINIKRKNTLPNNFRTKGSYRINIDKNTSEELNTSY